MLSIIINSPELSAGIIILSSYVAITLIFTALCTLTVNIAVKRNNRPITAQTITTTTRQARGNKLNRNNRQRKVA